MAAKPPSTQATRRHLKKSLFMDHVLIPQLELLVHNNLVSLDSTTLDGDSTELNARNTDIELRSPSHRTRQKTFRPNFGPPLQALEDSASRPPCSSPAPRTVQTATTFQEPVHSASLMFVNPNPDLRTPTIGHDAYHPGLKFNITLFTSMINTAYRAWNQNWALTNAVTDCINTVYRLPSVQSSDKLSAFKNRELLCRCVLKMAIKKYKAIVDLLPPPDSPPLVKPFAGCGLQPYTPSRARELSETISEGFATKDVSPTPGPSTWRPFSTMPLASSPLPPSSPTPAGLSVRPRRTGYTISKQGVEGEEYEGDWEEEEDKAEEETLPPPPFPKRCGEEREELSPPPKICTKDTEQCLSSQQEQEQDIPPPLPPSKLTKGKGKGRHLSPVQEEEDNDGNDSDSEERHPHQPAQHSPPDSHLPMLLVHAIPNPPLLPKNLQTKAESQVEVLNSVHLHLGMKKGQVTRKDHTRKTEARLAVESFDQTLREIAQKAGHSEVALKNAMGLTMKNPRNHNMWNIYQHFATAEDGLNMQKDEGQSAAEFTAILRDVYQRTLDLPERERDEVLAGLWKYYDSKMATHVAGFISRAQMTYKTYQLSVFGWVVDPWKSHLWLTGDLCPDDNIKQMKWGDNFADLCYKHQVTLVNWPKGTRIPGFPGKSNGLSEIMKLPLNILKCIVKDRINYWKSQLKDLTKQADAMSLYEDDSLDEEDNLSVTSISLDEDQLIRFVAWTDGDMLTLG
ncbi:hypothetical protein GYMLUDRAFT_240640 [Collybiopsis luxurians FD-317 M1]|nr:hypothetical protein GYMLUDRAFT_240640 [Collybiopsis luxurians FD-317 M1]